MNNNPRGDLKEQDREDLSEIKRNKICLRKRVTRSGVEVVGMIIGSCKFGVAQSGHSDRLFSPQP